MCDEKDSWHKKAKVRVNRQKFTLPKVNDRFYCPVGECPKSYTRMSDVGKHMCQKHSVKELVESGCNVPHYLSGQGYAQKLHLYIEAMGNRLIREFGVDDPADEGGDSEMGEQDKEAEQDKVAKQIDSLLCKSPDQEEDGVDLTYHCPKTPEKEELPLQAIKVLETDSTKDEGEELEYSW